MSVRSNNPGMLVRGLYGITPDLADTALLLDKTEQVLAGGAQLIQYRNKTANTGLRFQQASTLLQLCKTYAVPLIVNDHMELAAEINADGVHLGKHDTNIAIVRKHLGPGKIIGASCYDCITLASEAIANGADYVAFGAFFSTSTKHDTVTAPIDILHRAKAVLNVPVVGIGGINLVNVPTLIKNGADAVAVCHSLYQADDICQTAVKFSHYFNSIRYII